MKSARVLNIISLIFNVLVLSLVVFVELLPAGKEIMNSYHLINVFASAIICATALLCIPFNIVGIVKKNRLPVAIYVFKLIGTVTVSLSLVFATLVLGYMNGFNIPEVLGNFSLDNPNFYLNLIIPALALIGFMFFDHTEKGKFPVVFLAIIPALLYSVAYIFNATKQAIPVNGSYDWYNITSINKLAVYIVFIGLVLAALLIAIIIYAINRGLGKLFFKEESTSYTNPYYDENDYVHEDEDEEIDNDNSDIEESNPIRNQEEFDDGDKGAIIDDKGEEIVVDEEEEEEIEPSTEDEDVDESLEEDDEPQEEEEEFATKDDSPSEPKTTKKTTKKTVKKPTTKKEVKDTSTTNNSGTKVYHLTKRKEDGMWAITFVGGKKPVKLFKTKKEAEEYLAILTKNQGATALIRNSKGAKAGKFASSIKPEDDSKK